MRPDGEEDRPRRRDRLEDECEDERPRRKKSALRWVIPAGLAAFVAIGGTFGVLMPWLEDRAIDSGAYAKKDPDQLAAEWKENPAGAVVRFGDGIELRGMLHAIDSNIHGQTHIDVRNVADDRGTHAHIYVLSKRARGGLVKCKVGDWVTVKARPAGSTYDTPWLIADDIRPGK